MRASKSLRPLEGELWVEDRRLVHGDYNHGPPGHTDVHVCSETDCA
jgi:hypothetical protein